MSEPRIVPISVDAFHMLKSRSLVEGVELLHGLMYVKTPESDEGCALRSWLRNYFEVLAETEARTRAPIRCGDSELEADLAIFSRSATSTGAPKLVIEVSDCQEDYDRVKVSTYAVGSVGECWLILTRTKQVEVYRKPENGAYVERALCQTNDLLVSSVFRNVRINVGEMFTQ